MEVNPGLLTHQFLFFTIFGQVYPAVLTHRDLGTPLSYIFQPDPNSQITNNRREIKMSLTREQFKSYPEYLRFKGYNQQSHVDLVENIARESKRFPPTYPRILRYFKNSPLERDTVYLTEKYSTSSSENQQNLSNVEEFMVRLFCALHSDKGHSSGLRMRICLEDYLDTTKYWKKQCFKDHSNSYENYSSCLSFLLPGLKLKKRVNAPQPFPATKTNDGVWKRFVKDAKEQ